MWMEQSHAVQTFFQFKVWGTILSDVLFLSYFNETWWAFRNSDTCKFALIWVWCFNLFFLIICIVYHLVVRMKAGSLFVHVLQSVRSSECTRHTQPITLRTPDKNYLLLGLTISNYIWLYVMTYIAVIHLPCYHSRNHTEILELGYLIK